MPSPLRPTPGYEPFAVYRQKGGALNKRMAKKRVMPTNACEKRALVECERECIDGEPGAETIACYMPLDIQATLDANRSGRTSKAAGGHGSADVAAMSGTGASEFPTTLPPIDGRQSGRQSAAAPKLPPPPQTAGTSPCMTKPDLREFVAAQRSAVAGVLALNPGQKTDEKRQSYKWPTKTMGSQVGGSLTKLDLDTANMHHSCGSAFRLGKKGG